MMKTMNIGGIEMEITPERQRRIVAAIADTQAEIDREMTQYSEQFRNQAKIAQCWQHIAKLQNMLKGA
jgi:Ni,Fe-hydrogenase III large subunit